MSRLLAYPRSCISLSFALATSLLSGCAPAKITLYDLAPVSPSVSWNRGVAMASCQDSGFSAEAGFVASDRLAAQIRVQVRNQSSAPLELDPQQFTIVTHILDSAGVDDPLRLPPVDPNLRIREIENARALESAKTNPYRYNGFDAVGDLLGGVVGIAGLFVKKTPEQRAQEEKDRQSEQDRREQRERDERDWDAMHDRTLASLDAQRDFWQRLAVGRTTLPPGGAEEGLLVLSLHPKASTVDLVLRVGVGECTIPFRQTSRVL